MNWLLSLIAKLFGDATPLELSPSDWLPHSAISTKGAVILVDTVQLIPGLIAFPKIWIPPIPSTGSMLPNFSHEHNNILVAGATKADHAKIIDHLHVGDIAVFRMMANPDDDPADFSKAHWQGGYAIHRIIGISSDKQGRFWTFKGDNNPVADRFKVRDINILHISIGTIF